MENAIGAIALCACVLSLAACDRTPSADPPIPVADKPAPAEAGAAEPGISVPVPPAASVFPPQNATPTEPTKETDGTRKPAMEPEEAAIPKPLPGQNNDHSAPLSTNQ